MEALTGDVVEIAGQILVPHVAGDLQQHGARLAAAQVVEGAAHELGHALGVVYLGKPLGDAAVVVGGVEAGRSEGAGGWLAAGDEQNGHVVRERLGGAGEGVLGAGALLHGEDAETLAAAGAAESVGDGHADALLPA